MSITNVKKIKYFKTESNSIKNNLLKNKILQLNYKLFEINQENRKVNLNKLILDKKDIDLKISIKSHKNKKISKTKNNLYINRLNNYNLNITNTFSNTKMKNSITSRNDRSYINNFHKRSNNTETKYTNNNKTYYKNNFFNNEFGLFPVSHKYKNKFTQNEMNLNDLNGKKDMIYFKLKNKKIFNNGFFKPKILNKYGKKRRNETEDNDMKAKIRFINLKRDLLDENLKINKMFGTFQKQILELEKTINSKLNHL